MNDQSDEMNDKPQRDVEELRSALVVHEKRRRDLKAAQKSITKQYRDDIADVDAEIAGVLEQLG